MKIKYIHSSEPEKTKIHDTVRSLKNNPFITVTNFRSIITEPPSQDEWDKFELSKFQEDKNKGLIVDYEVIEE